MKKVLNGFLLGLGFSIAFALFMTIWAITAQPRIEAMFEESYSKVKSDFDTSFIDSMGLKIDKTVIQDQSVLINYKVNNIGSGLASLYSVRFTLKASNGQFMVTATIKYLRLLLIITLFFFQFAVRICSFQLTSLMLPLLRLLKTDNNFNL